MPNAAAAIAIRASGGSGRTEEEQGGENHEGDGPREQQGVRSVAGEVLARESSRPASEPSARPVPIITFPCVPETMKPPINITIATSTTNSTSGNDPHGAAGGSSAPGRRGRLLALVATR